MQSAKTSFLLDFINNKRLFEIVQGERMDKIYDNIFRTLSEKNPRLLIPIINMLFGTDYDMTDHLDLLSGEHHLLPNAELDNVGEIITDSCICLENKLYHMECQSTPDGSMILRMVEYDFYIALEHAIKVDNMYEMVFPQSVVLYLRHTGTTPDNLLMKIYFPNNEQITYAVPVVKTQQFDADMVVNKKLFFLIPYYILRYENQLDSIDGRILIEEYQKLYNGMIEAYDTGFLEEYDMTNIVQFTQDLVYHVCKDNDQVIKGVMETMGGVVLETYADKMIAKGHTEGEIAMAKLAEQLLEEGRIEDLKRCSNDASFRNSLLAEYHLD